jgi:formylglycine-generating enzyme required for sulfatase activity
MPSPQRKRTIFVSSTKHDLEEYREVAERAIRLQGQVPERFECDWSARSGKLVAECEKAVEAADAMVLIVAHCYGTVPSAERGGREGKSVTWLEYEKARKSEIPIFVFLVDESYGWSGPRETDRIRTESKNRAAVMEAVDRLDEFREILKSNHTPVFFTTPEDLSEKVSAAVGALRSGGDGGESEADVLPGVLRSLTPKERLALRQYLEEQAKAWQVVPLFHTDKKRSESATELPNLASVYVALNVEEPRPKMERGAHSGRRNRAAKGGGPETSGEPWTALEAAVDNRRVLLLGDPGSGKSTFVKVLGVALASRAARALGTADIGSPRLDAIATSFEQVCVPVLVVVRDFAADMGDEDEDKRIMAHVGRTLTPKSEGQPGFRGAIEPLHQLLREGEAVLILDGLDEINDLTHRDEVVKSICAFAKAYRKTRIVVTCRVAAYRAHEQACEQRSEPSDFWLPEKEFPKVTLRQFNQAQRDEFVEGWYAEQHSKGWISGDLSAWVRSLRAAIRRRDLEELAGQPLLLTMMAVVHASQGGVLPDHRVKLYKEAVEALMVKWLHGRSSRASTRSTEQGRGVETPGVDDLLRQANVNSDDLEGVLREIALNVHEGASDRSRRRTPDGGTADIPSQLLEASLARLHKNEVLRRPWAVGLVSALTHKSGLLIERRIGHFAFPHRMLQEYLAARGQIAAKVEEAELVKALMAKRGAANDVWREVILMVGGVFAHLDGAPDKGLPLVKALHAAAVDAQSSRRVPDLILAADLLVEMRCAKLDRSEDGRRVHETLVKSLAQGFLPRGRSLPIRERAALGSALGRLGDPRDGVAQQATTADGRQYPTIGLSSVIEAGEFPMGNDERAGTTWLLDERPRFAARIETPYQVGLYPVTVAQYRCFIAAGGYEPGVCDRYWTAAGLAWRGSRKITGPELSGEVFQTPNHPQVGVSWYEAVAFCRWLSDVSGLSYRLPTEMEWERAARHTDARTYPWGEADTEEKVQANANVAGVLDHTSPVGLFADGAAACGAVDLAGNVWEWCQSEWRKDYTGYPQTSRLDEEEDERSRVVRGGSWGGDPEFARCATRDGYVPDGRLVYLGFRVCVCPCSRSDL